MLFLVSATETKAAEKEEVLIYKKRMELFKKTEWTTGVPWYYLAAVDQYERSIRSVRSDLPKPAPDELAGLLITPEKWAGPLNPVKDTPHPLSVAFFEGFGTDGNDDSKASRVDPEDLLHAFAMHIASYGVDDSRVRMALWDYYKRDQTVRIIMGHSKVYRHFKTVNLDKKAFPIPRQYNYTYNSTWGAGRGWGGRRIHEGTDIFAGYGVPVRAVAYGIVEMKGWNKYGGWRIGIRDLNNTYHYYAHLNGFAKDIEVGRVVEPGMVIGSVGSSGYGPPGTSGKFPPHLHFGMYKDSGRNEWSFDPYPYLKLWERQERKQ